MRQILLLVVATLLFVGSVALGDPSDEVAVEPEVAGGEETLSPAQPDENIRTVEPKRQKLAEEMASGFIRAIRKESAVWWECGEPTPKDQWKERAETMAYALLDALDKHDDEISPWGVWGVIWSESRGNRCSIGPNPRKYARRVGIIDSSQNPHLWTEEEVRAVLRDPKWRGRTADLGLGQVVWKKYARLPCEKGEPGCYRENRKWVRVPTLDEMLSIDGGAEVTAYGMASRRFWSGKKKRTKIPWIYWPGNRADYSYARKISDIVKTMGGPYRQVLGYK